VKKRALSTVGTAVILAAVLTTTGCASGKRSTAPTPYPTTMTNSDGTTVRCVVFGDKIDCEWKDPE
jgi:hypothetical protein